MTQLTVTTREGDVHALEIASGFSVMEVIRNAGIDELLALCGGCLSCATCHVIVDPADAPRLAPASREEQDLLDGLDDREATSRLACQIALDERLDGLRVTIRPEA